MVGARDATSERGARVVGLPDGCGSRLHGAGGPLRGRFLDLA